MADAGPLAGPGGVAYEAAPEPEPEAAAQEPEEAVGYEPEEAVECMSEEAAVESEEADVSGCAEPAIPLALAARFTAVDLDDLCEEILAREEEVSLPPSEAGRLRDTVRTEAVDLDDLCSEELEHASAQECRVSPAMAMDVDATSEDHFATVDLVPISAVPPLPSRAAGPPYFLATHSHSVPFGDHGGHSPRITSIDRSEESEQLPIDPGPPDDDLFAEPSASSSGWPSGSWPIMLHLEAEQKPRSPGAGRGGRDDEAGRLSSYFARPYLRGDLFRSGGGYAPSRARGCSMELFEWAAGEDRISVWAHALDLRPLCRKGRLLVLYHYTSELAFTSVCGRQLRPGELLSSLTSDRREFGCGLYASCWEPATWGSSTRVLLNSFSNVDPWRPTDPEQEKEVRARWGDHCESGHSARCCVPILVHEGIAFNVHHVQTPEMRACMREPSCGRSGQLLHPGRDVWVIVPPGDAGAGTGLELELDEGILDICRVRLARRRKIHGVTHPETLWAVENLASLLRAERYFAEAEELYVEAVAGLRTNLGRCHPMVLAMLEKLASLAAALGDATRAEALLREVLNGRHHALGLVHPDTLRSVHSLAMLLRSLERTDEAEALYRRASADCKALLGESRTDTLVTSYNLATLLRTTGRWNEATEAYKQVFDASQKAALESGLRSPHRLNAGPNAGRNTAGKDVQTFIPREGRVRADSKVGSSLCARNSEGRMTFAV